MSRWLGCSVITTAFVLGITVGALRERRRLPLLSSSPLEARREPEQYPEVAERREGPEEIVQTGQDEEGVIVVVTNVIDGDTIDTSIGRVRLLGIDTPEQGDCYAEEAREALQEMTIGREVILSSDPSQGDRDRFGRLLRFVELGGKDISATLVADGFARVFTEYPVSRTDHYIELDREAREEGRGMWGECVEGHLRSSD